MFSRIFPVWLALVLAWPAGASGQPEPLATVPFRVSNYHLIVRVKLNGHGPFNFLFDSGAGATLLMKEVADSLGLQIAASRQNVGVSGAHEVGAIKGISVSLDGVDLGMLTLLSTRVPLEELDSGGKVHGVIGYPVFSRYVVRINYRTSQLELYNKNTYRYAGKGVELPIWLFMRLPLAEVEVTLYDSSSFTGVFLIDTGARSDLIINSPTVVRYDMAGKIGRYYTVRQRIGTSERRSKMRFGRLRAIRIGTYKFEHVPVALSSDNKGVLSLRDFDGIIGNRMLSRFDIVFDYERQKIYLEPGVNIGNPYEINSSGLAVTFKDGRPFVKDVIDGTQAARAGLKAGDEIVSINTRKTGEMTPAEIRNSFFGDGEWVELVIRRNNKFKYTRFRLEPLI